MLIFIEWHSFSGEKFCPKDSVRNKKTGQLIEITYGISYIVYKLLEQSYSVRTDKFTLDQSSSLQVQYQNAMKNETKQTEEVAQSFKSIPSEIC